MSSNNLQSNKKKWLEVALESFETQLCSTIVQIGTLLGMKGGVLIFMSEH